MRKHLGRPLFYGWVVVGVIFFTYLFQSGARAAFGVFYVALIDDLGWSHASTAAAFSISAIVSSASGVAVGLAIDRIGPRRIMPVGALVVAAGLALTSQVAEIWQFYATYSILVAFGGAGLGFGALARLISSWFRRQRGAAIGIAMAGTGVGSMILLPLAQIAVDQVGWRTAYLLIAGVVVLLVPVLAGLIRERPDELGLHPDGDPAPAPLPGLPTSPGATVEPEPDPSPARRRAFCLLLVANVGSGTGMMLAVHQVAYLVDRGFPPIVAASAVGAAGLLSAIGQLTAGTLSDRLGRRPPMFVAAGLFAAGMAMLLAVKSPADGWILTAYAILYGLSWGGFNTVGGTIETDILHGKRLGFLMGFMALAFSSSGAITTWVAGAVRDQLGSYGVVFAIPAVFIVLSALSYSLGLAVWERRAARFVVRIP